MGAWEGIFRQGFHQKVDRREALLLVCFSVGMEVARKSRQLKLPKARCFEDDLASVRLREDCSTTEV